MCPSIAGDSVCIMHQLHGPEGRGLKPEICVWDNHNKSHIVWFSTLAGMNLQIFKKKQALRDVMPVKKAQGENPEVRR